MDTKASTMGSSRICHRLKTRHPNLLDAHNNYSTRAACSYATKGNKVNSIKEAQNLSAAFSSTNSSTSSHSSSSSSSSLSNFSSRVRSLAVQQKRSLWEKKMNIETSSPRKQIETAVCRGADINKVNSQPMPGVARIGVETSNSEATSSAILQRKHRSGSRNLYAPTISSIQRSIASREKRLAIANDSRAKKCIVSPISNTEKDKTKCLDGGKASSSRGKSISAFSNRKLMGSSTAQNDSKSSNKYTTIGQLPLQRAQKVAGGRGSTRMSSGEGNASLTLPEASIVPWVPQNGFSVSLLPDNALSFIGHSMSARTELMSRSDLVTEEDIRHIFSDPSGVRDNNRHFNFENVAEALLVLEVMQHNQALAHEQLLVLERETTVVNSYFYDQYRGMRMDIDNMSYEELLDLGEKIGSVNTGLTEEVMAKCLERTAFKEASSTREAEEADKTCSICQECCADGDEVCRLGCDHWFHADCIQQWLRVKNWCPICKASAYNS
ncbi:E3 ubiquitin ligase BIG BROTHER-related [Apostasia shenzhenica]|uniref:RING-type E3 ubiquitin transferase n=1 Tax=Apostasia shenzhenica TaxID=1088818 RepID=A0A2I0AM16_9ASPA|nr:E3 ubiquitin ligase BIG BROTHER-related [Apostasia shenzhenica]